MHVLHVVHQSLPTMRNGYTLRTKGILYGQEIAGIKPKVMSADFVRRGTPSMDHQLGVMHMRCTYPDSRVLRLLDESESDLGHVARQLWQVRLLAKRIEAAAGAFSDLIHAHSPWPNGVAAAIAGKRLGIPVVYEVRGLQEESAIADMRWERGGFMHRAFRAGETLAMRSAQAVLPICQGIKKEVLKRVYPSERRRLIETVPNCVDPDVFRPYQANLRIWDEEHRSSLRRTYGLAADDLVVGYCGSVRPLEGVETLLRAFPTVVRHVPKAKLLIAANGPFQHLVELSIALGIPNACRWVTDVPHEDMPNLYRALDVFAVTRPDTEVTRKVTPLKPLEAMATGIPVVAAALPALFEVCSTGRFYRPGNLVELAARIKALLSMTPSERRKVGLEGRRHVCEDRNWVWLGERYRRIYAELGIGGDDGRADQAREKEGHFPSN